ncbi:MAG TPA: hypothetical protein VLG17_24360, partial [Pseudomonas sp.]|uniref:hypothetical protein n=1 Tax=Pseudomonas sp. TaxID=306 RepID=UPI002CC8939C
MSDGLAKNIHPVGWAGHREIERGSPVGLHFSAPTYDSVSIALRWFACCALLSLFGCSEAEEPASKPTSPQSTAAQSIQQPQQ